MYHAYLRVFYQWNWQGRIWEQSFTTDSERGNGTGLSCNIISRLDRWVGLGFTADPVSQTPWFSPYLCYSHSHCLLVLTNFSSSAKKCDCHYILCLSHHVNLTSTWITVSNSSSVNHHWHTPLAREDLWAEIILIWYCQFKKSILLYCKSIVLCRMLSWM